MNKWKIKFFMKSGDVIRVQYPSDETDSGKVFENLLRDNSVWYGFRGIDEDENTNIFVRLCEVESVHISVFSN